MKICLLGDISGHLDEGMKNTTYHLTTELSKSHDVLTINPRNIIYPNILYKIKNFSPDVIHYVHGPTLRSFAIIRLLNVLIPKAATVMSALRPKVNDNNINWLLGYRPDLLLVQSNMQERTYTNLGFKTHFFPAGVDTKRFVPVSKECKVKLRRKHQLPLKSYLVLHVGQISQVRELDKLIPLQLMDEIQVVIVGAKTILANETIVTSLKDAGCIVMTNYVERIEEFYQCADCFVFPGNGLTSAVEIPLSVLEAMACNLPVITGRFGGLPDLFIERDGFYFADSDKKILKSLNHILHDNSGKIKVREMVGSLSWESLAIKLMKIYKDLLNEMGGM